MCVCVCVAYISYCRKSLQNRAWHGGDSSFEVVPSVCPQRCKVPTAGPLSLTPVYEVSSIISISSELPKEAHDSKWQSGDLDPGLSDSRDS